MPKSREMLQITKYPRLPLERIEKEWEWDLNPF